MPKKGKGKGGKGDDWEDPSTAGLEEKMQGLGLADGGNEKSEKTGERAIKGEAKAKTQNKSSKKMAALKALMGDNEDGEEVEQQ